MKSNDLVEHDIIKCYHCGNETPMTKVGEYSWGSRDLENSEFDFFNRYELFACPVCHKVTLRHVYGVSVRRKEPLRVHRKQPILVH